MQDLSEVLAQLHDVHEPNPIGWWPPTFAWWILVVGSIAILCFLYFLIRKRLRSLKRKAIFELESIVRDFNIHQSDERLLKDLSVFLRRVALSKYRLSSAGITGTQWISHLDDMSSHPVLTERYSELLLNGPYQQSICFDSKAFLSDLRLWVGKLND